MPSGMVRRFWSEPFAAVDSVRDVAYRQAAFPRWLSPVQRVTPMRMKRFRVKRNEEEHIIQKWDEFFLCFTKNSPCVPPLLRKQKDGKRVLSYDFPYLVSSPIFRMSVTRNLSSTIICQKILDVLDLARELFWYRSMHKVAPRHYIWFVQ